MIWKTAWKNVWRNRTRSFVVIASVTTGVFAAVFSIAFMNGMIAQRFDAAINEEISHIQVTGKGFRLNNDPVITINDVQNTIEKIKSTPGVEGTVRRSITGGMASTANGSAGVEITGIDPSGELKIFSLDKTIIAGTGDFFRDTTIKDQVLIGQDLAKELNIVRFFIDGKVIKDLDSLGVPSTVISKLDSLKGKRFSGEKLFDKALKQVLSKKESKEYFYLIKGEAWSYRKGSRLTLTFLDKDNNQVGARFRIAGIYDTKNTIFEMSSVFVRNSDLKALTGYGELDYNQVIARISNIDQTDDITKEIREKLPWAEVMSWKELRPDLAMMTDYVHQIYGILMVIIMAALAFGIVNTMLMVVLERTKELGMLSAIGMNKQKVFTMIMLESVFLSAIGGLIGMLASWIVIFLTSRNGINFIQYAEGMEAFGYSAHVFPEIKSSFFIMMSILVVITGIISSIYPAFKALKLNPVEAIRSE
ncbi:MAG TPA: FtsX-like permease family protein [Bacteroidales bacterium]|nr:FtsX-like permease family protein [Bacteroidales bacterium]